MTDRITKLEKKIKKLYFPRRNHCEMCGNRLTKEEKPFDADDYTKIVICRKCFKKEYQ